MLWSVISTSEISLNMLATALLGLGLSQERENKKGKRGGKRETEVECHYLSPWIEQYLE